VLVERGVDKQAKTDGGATPLHWAAQGGQLEVIRVLVQLGVDKEEKD
jgi:ankyrin repeat protein